MPLKILLADDHLVLLAGMRALLEREGYQVVADVSDGRQAVNLARKLQPHIAVLDITMPGLNGLAAAQKIRRLCPDTKVIILTMHKETPYVIEALDAEVMGYVLKTQAAQDLLAAINSVAANNVYLSQGISQVVVDAYRNKNGPDGHRLTLREREVLQLIAEGHRTRQVAGLLNISVKTAESHRGRIMRKLGIHDTVGLVRYAIRNGLSAP
ncbi:MAG TPA: response regulator transcription factor [Gammaproteobacteria bacterium]|nr:response regulator transcription factor [Gammaproteobacteria bacterium]